MIQPNILLFLMDACQAAALERASSCQTPNFNRLIDRGVQFHRAYCPTPTCSPSRASLMTGLLAHNHGVLEVEHGRDPDQCVLRTDKPHWAQRLAAAGYETGYFGKWHLERSGKLEDFGWNRYHAKGAKHHAGLGAGIEPSAQNLKLDPTLTRYHRGPAGYNDILHYGVTDTPAAERYPAYTTGQALEFIREAAKPWCACASFSEPNEALVVSRETFEKYDVDSIPLPSSLRDQHEGRPNLYKRQREIAAEMTDDEWRMARACYFGRITELDEQFGRLLDEIDLESTTVIVTADHGRYVGAHGFEAHNFGPFEEIYRVPMIVAGPGITRGESDSLVGFHDLCPTVLELAGAEPIDVPDSTSFAPVLRNPSAKSRNGLFAENHGTRFRLTQRIWWEGDWKFVFNGFDYDELYNLAEDPDELTNLAGRPEHGDRERAMMAEIWRVIQETGDRTLNETHYFSMRMGLVGPEA
ncbi:MAG: choline-sulfatase [Verrucomicrobiales bacterium]|jgi:choline-sulfatase